jgi:GcrA cell cycle regulator
MISEADMKVDNTPWPKEKEDRLRVLWMQGLSASQIGKELGKTRNAIIAKRDRMGLPERLAHRSTPKKLTRAAKPAQRLPEPKQGPVSPRGAPRRDKASVRFIERKPDQCAMFCEGEEGALGFVCGAPAELGRVWCSDCAGKVYAPGNEKREAA